MNKSHNGTTECFLDFFTAIKSILGPFYTTYFPILSYASIQQVKSLSFDKKPWKRYLFRGEAYLYGPLQGVSPRQASHGVVTGADCVVTPRGECGGGGVLPYIGYIGMCGAKGYGFLAVLVWNKVSIFISTIFGLK